MRGTALLATTLLGACSASPQPRQPELQRVAGRVTAIDLGLQSSVRRLDNLQRRLAEAPGELMRLDQLARPQSTSRDSLLSAPLRRVAALPTTLARLAGGELNRRPEPPAELWRQPQQYARDLAEGVVTAATLLQGSAHPLDESDDRHHRTSPHDDRPEASWLDRIRRRLRW